MNDEEKELGKQKLNTSVKNWVRVETIEYLTISGEFGNQAGLEKWIYDKFADLSTEAIKEFMMEVAAKNEKKKGVIIN